MAGKTTFLVHILSCQNTTWQGNVTWTETKESKSFRSMLELIKLMDAAVNTEGTEREANGQENMPEGVPGMGWAASLE